MKLVGYIVFVLYMFCSFWLLLTALLQLHLFCLSKKKTARKSGGGQTNTPFVSIQVPVYNEKYVIEDLLRSLALLNYPPDRYEVQVLDDSTDETSAIIDSAVAALERQQVNIYVLRRKERTGYKAGALQFGLPVCKGDLIAIFDADFRPSPDFLQKLLPHFNDANVGLVQARWGHENVGQNFLTRIQSYLLDMHFKVEQAGRYNAGYFMNFSGTAGIWRKQCIIDAGGWDSNVLSEDLDISYRAQLKGWSIVFDGDVEVPAQLPAVVEAFRIQQFRWTKGIAQIARKTVAQILQLKLPLAKKLHSLFHLLSSFTFICIFLNALLSLPLLLLRSIDAEFIQLTNYTMIAALNLVALTFIYYRSAKTSHTGISSFLLHYPIFLVVYLAMSVQNTVAVMQGLAGMRSPFLRTPKANGNGTPDGYLQKKLSWVSLLELAMLLYFCWSIYLSFYLGDYFLLSFFVMFSAGLIILLYQTFKPYFIQRRAVTRQPVIANLITEN